MIKGGLNHFSDPVLYQLIMSHKKVELLWLIKYISIVLFFVTLKERCTQCTDGAILKKHDAIFLATKQNVLFCKLQYDIN